MAKIIGNDVGNIYFIATAFLHLKQHIQLMVSITNAVEENIEKMDF